MMIFGAILAGGTGSRMNIADMPKQFLPLGDKPIILHTLEKFLLCDRMDRVYVGVHPDWVGHMQDLLERQVPQRERVTLVPGGGDRNSTIFNIELRRIGASRTTTSSLPTTPSAPLSPCASSRRTSRPPAPLAPVTQWSPRWIPSSSPKTVRPSPRSPTGG